MITSHHNRILKLKDKYSITELSVKSPISRLNNSSNCYMNVFVHKLGLRLQRNYQEFKDEMNIQVIQLQMFGILVFNSSVVI